MALGGHEEIFDHRLLVDSDFAASSPHISESVRPFTLTCAPGTAVWVQLGLSVLPGEGSPEVKEVYPVEPGEVTRVLLVRAERRHRVL